MDRDRVEDALDRLAADLAGRRPGRRPSTGRPRTCGRPGSGTRKSASRRQVCQRRDEGTAGRIRMSTVAIAVCRRGRAALRRARGAGGVRAHDRRSTPGEHQRRARTADFDDRHRDHRAAARSQGPDHPPAARAWSATRSRRPLCTEEQLNADACPADSDVGDVVQRRRRSRWAASCRSPTVNGDLYNVVPRAGEPARFGIVLNAPPFTVPIRPAVCRRSSCSRRRRCGRATSASTPCSPTCRTRRRSPGCRPDRHQLALADPLGTGRHPAEGLHPPPDLVQDPHGRLRRHRLRRPDRERHSDVRHRPTAPRCRSRRAQRRGSSASAPSTRRSSSARRSRRRSKRPACCAAQVILPAGLGGNNEALNNKCSQAAFAAGTCPPPSIVGSAAATSPLQSAGAERAGRAGRAGRARAARPRHRPARPAGAEAQGHARIHARRPQHRRLRQPARHPDLALHAHLRRRPERARRRQPRRLRAAAAGLRRDLPRPLGGDVATTATPTVDCSGATGGGGGNGGGQEAAGEDQARPAGLGRADAAAEDQGRRREAAPGEAEAPAAARFAAGKDFDRGAERRARSRSTHTTRTLKLRAGKPAKRSGGKFADGALKPGKGLARTRS